MNQQKAHTQVCGWLNTMSEQGHTTCCTYQPMCALVIINVFVS